MTVLLKQLKAHQFPEATADNLPFDAAAVAHEASADDSSDNSVVRQERWYESCAPPVTTDAPPAAAPVEIPPAK